MLQETYSAVMGSQKQQQQHYCPLGFTVMQPLANNSSLPTASTASLGVPPPRDPEDYELRFTVDLARQTLQPLSVVGLSESDGARLLVFAQPMAAATTPSEATSSSSQAAAPPATKVYEAPAHNPRDLMPYQVGREYLVCLRFPAKSAVALISFTADEQKVHTKELALLPYWTMKCLERGGQGEGQGQGQVSPE